MSAKPPPPPRPKPPLPSKKPPPPPTPKKKEDSVLDLLPDPEPSPPVEAKTESKKEEEKKTSEPAKVPEPEPSVPDPPTVPLRAALGSDKPEWRVKLEGAVHDVRKKVDDYAKDKPAYTLPVIGGSAAVVLVIGLLVIGKIACGSSSSVATIASATPSSTTAVATNAPRPNPAPTGPVFSACALSGERRTIAPKALASSGIEVAALGNEVAVGFAATPNDATLEILDPSNASTATRVLGRSNDAIRRVLPLSRTTATLDVDRKRDPLHVRRTLLADPPVDVGGSDDAFVWAAHKTDKTTTLWPLPQSHVPLEQVRGDALPDGKGFAIAFRQGSTVYAGAFGGSPPAPLGPLVHVDGLGTTGGAPVIAASGERVMIAWSDRAQPTETWHVRTASFRVGDTEAQPHAFNTPAGGLGEQTMSPDLTSLGSGRFLLLWTEGTTTHQVRGAVLGEDGSTTSAFAVSPDGADAGQGQAAVLDDGRGVAAYLSATSPGFYEAVAAPLKCAAK